MNLAWQILRLKPLRTAEFGELTKKIEKSRLVLDPS